MTGQKVIVTIFTIVVIGLLIGTVGSTTLGGLEDMVSDAEDYEKTTISEYENSDIALWYNYSAEANNTHNQFKFTTLSNNGTVVKSNVTYIFEKTDYHYTRLYKNESNKDPEYTEKEGEGSFEVNDSYVNNFNWVRWNWTVDNTETYTNDTAKLHLSYANMTVSTDHTHSEATIDLMSLLPIVTAIGILFVLVAIVIKVRGF